MAVEKTNAEEREAIKKIEEILKDFDPRETYVGKAFEGCVEQAKENVDNDFLFGWKSRYLDEQAKNCRLSDKVEALMKTLNQKDDAIARYVDVVQGKDREISRLNGVISQRDDNRQELLEKVSDTKEEVEDLKRTIIGLKAKLYDLMTAGEEVEE